MSYQSGFASCQPRTTVWVPQVTKPSYCENVCTISTQADIRCILQGAATDCVVPLALGYCQLRSVSGPGTAT